jgi:hypothetical protein
MLMVIPGEEGHHSNRDRAWQDSACLQTANQPHVRWPIHKKPNTFNAQGRYTCDKPCKKGDDKTT